MRKIYAVALLAAVAAPVSTPTPAHAQQRGAGLGITLQNSLVFRVFEAEPIEITGIQPALTVPIWATEQLVLEPSVSFWTLKDDATVWRLGGAFEYHFADGRISPFVGGRITLVNFSPDEGDGFTDWLISPIGGAEVFVLDQFSLGGEVSLNFYMAEDVNGFERNGPTYTDAALRVRFYF